MSGHRLLLHGAVVRQVDALRGDGSGQRERLAREHLAERVERDVEVDPLLVVDDAALDARRALEARQGDRQLDFGNCADRRVLDVDAAEIDGDVAGQALDQGARIGALAGRLDGGRQDTGNRRLAGRGLGERADVDAGDRQIHVDAQRVGRAVEDDRALDVAAVEPELAQLDVEHAALERRRQRDAADLEAPHLDAADRDVDVGLGLAQGAQIERRVGNRGERVARLATLGRHLGLLAWRLRRRRQVAVDVEHPRFDIQDDLDDLA